MKLYNTARSYCLAMTVPQFMRMDKMEEKVLALDREFPIEKLEFNGHFGANLFFQVSDVAPDKFDSVAVAVSERIAELLKCKPIKEVEGASHPES